MANNNNNNNNRQSNEHVEFSVKAEEDLYLEGTETTIRRVTAETNYSCLMLKTQRFSSLFRHYAKYHGLRKEELEYYFMNLLENEDTPETVQLQRGDTIMVRKRRKPEPPHPSADDSEFIKDMRDLLDDEEHMDCSFYIRENSNNTAGDVKMEDDDDDDYDPIDDMNDDDNNDKKITVIRAHKSILTARAEYFKALFRTNKGIIKQEFSYREANECIVTVDPPFTAKHIRAVLEFIYTNRILKMQRLNTDDLLSLLLLADKWLLGSMKRVLQHELRKHITANDVARLYSVAHQCEATILMTHCMDYIKTHLRQLASNQNFNNFIEEQPDMCLPILKATADLVPQQPSLKKQRVVPDPEPSFPISYSK